MVWPAAVCRLAWIIGDDSAIVSEEAGTTRGRHFAAAEWNGRAFWLVDTGGLREGSDVPMDAEIRRQVQVAIEEADLLLLVMDAQVGVHPSDARIVALLREAGKPWDIGPGNPNYCERIESGLLSYGGDTDDLTNPFEVRLGKYVDLRVPDEVIGIAALRRIDREGILRQQLGVLLDGDEPADLGFHWHPLLKNGKVVGRLTNRVWSYRLKRNIGFGLVSADCAVDDRIELHRQGQVIGGRLTSLPFV